MWEQIVDLAHNEIVAYAGMMLILSAFFLETRDILNSKEWPYLVLMALGSGLLAVRAYLIDEWAFFILEVAWFAAAALGIGQLLGVCNRWNRISRTQYRKNRLQH